MKVFSLLSIEGVISIGGVSIGVRGFGLIGVDILPLKSSDSK